MSSNDVCRLHTEYSTFANKPKKVKFNKKSSAHQGMMSGITEENEYDAIHDNSYYVTQLPTDDLYMGGEDHDLYFHDDEYSNSDDNNNLSSNDSASESNQNQNQNPGTGYTSNNNSNNNSNSNINSRSSSNSIKQCDEISSNTQSAGNTTGGGIDPSGMYSTTFDYSPVLAFDPYHIGKHVMLCQPSNGNNRPPQRLGSNKVALKSAPLAAMLEDVYEETVLGSIGNSGYPLDSTSHSLDVERGNVVFNIGSDAIRHVSVTANSSSNNTSSASSGLTSRDGSLRQPGETPPESLGMRQSSSFNDVLQALGRIGEPQYFDASKGRERETGAVKGVGTGADHGGPEAGYGPYGQVKMYGNTVQHNDSQEGSQGQHVQGYTHVRTGYPLKSFMPLPLSSSALPSYLLQTGATFNASKPADSNRSSTHHTADISVSNDTCHHNSSSNSNELDRLSHSQSQLQHTSRQSHQRHDSISNDATPLQSYPDRPVLATSYSFPTPSHRSSFSSNTADDVLYRGHHTAPQPLPQHLPLPLPQHLSLPLSLSHHTTSRRDATEGNNAEYAARTHTNESDTFVSNASFTNNNNSSSGSKLSTDIHRMNDKISRASIDLNTGTSTAHRYSNNAQDFFFKGASNTRTRSPGNQHDFQPHSQVQSHMHALPQQRTHLQTHPQTPTQSQTQLQTNSQIQQSHTRRQGCRDEDIPLALGPLIPPPDTYSSRSVQSLLSKLPQSTHASALGRERDDYPKSKTPTQIAETADGTRREGAMLNTHTYGALRSVPPVQDPSMGMQRHEIEVEGKVGTRVGVSVGGQGRNGVTADNEDIDIMDSSFAADILLAYAAQKYGQTADTTAPSQPLDKTSTLRNAPFQCNMIERDVGDGAGSRRGELDTHTNNIGYNKNNGNDGITVSYNCNGQTGTPTLSSYGTASDRTSRKRERGTGDWSESDQGTEI